MPELEVLKVRDLFLEKRFDELNQMLDQRLHEVLADPVQEKHLYKLYDVFGENDPRAKALLDEWVAAYPDHYQPLVARGSYFEGAGWNARGVARASETRDEQFARMYDLFDSAREEFRKALALEERAIMVYSRLMDMGRASKEQEELRQYLRKGLAVAPASYRIRASYLSSLEPRWGGSFKAMEAFASQAQRYADDNPKMSFLIASVWIEAGRGLRHNSQSKAALEAYENALNFGERSAPYYGMARVYINEEQYEKAIKVLDKAIDIDPHAGGYYRWRSVTYRNLGQLEKAYEELQKALVIHPFSDSILMQKEYLAYAYSERSKEHESVGRYREALADSNKAVRLHGDKAYYHYRNGRMHGFLKQFDQAERNLARAITLDEDNVDYYQMMDWTLFQRQKYDEIIAYWDQYLELVPENPVGYHERGGAKYHKGDYPGAFEDAKKSRDLGHPNGEQVYQKMKRLVD
ncbi:MAG: tetratricopeptide repeat protein [Pseudomonadota bacterium]